MQEHCAEISYLFGPVKFAIKQIRNAYMRICQLFLSYVIFSIQNASFPNLITKGLSFILLKVQFQ